ncbi:MAG: circularly permuted type 2 ATP-grasp protein, partial [Pseudomonas neustonica]
MQQAANAVTPLQALLGDYPGHAGHDELLDADRQPRAHWQGLLDDIAALGADTLVARSEEAQNLLHENGVTFNPYEDDPGQLRSWQLDCVPWVISTEEWELLEAGLKQRSRLLEHLLDDLYGARRVIQEGLLPAELIFTHPGFLFSAADDPPQVD